MAQDTLHRHDQAPLRDAAWFDAQYDNRRRVPEFAQHLQRWRETSAAARASLGCELDLPYVHDPAGAPVALDVFLPDRAALAGPAPVLVFLHGGYWRALDKADFSFVAAPFVAAGALVVVPNYSLCPAVGIDTIALQAAQCLAWVHRNAQRFGAAAARNVVCGHSAGGHLAAMLLACDGRLVARGLPQRLTRRAVSISGLYELAPIAATPFLQADLHLSPELVARASPAGFAAPAGARLCSVVGSLESEEFLRQNDLIRARWGAQCVPVCESLPGCNHFTVLDELVRPGSSLLQRVGNWLQA